MIQSPRISFNPLSQLSFILSVVILGIALIISANTQFHIQAANAQLVPVATRPAPVICISQSFDCRISNEIAAKLKGHNLANAIMTGANYADPNGVTVNLSSTSFADTIMSQQLDPSTGNSSTPINFSNDNFTGADWSFASMAQAPSINFTNANFTNATFASSQWNVGNVTLTGVTWLNTTCPDGTNSNSNGNTCVGHGF